MKRARMDNEDLLILDNNLIKEEEEDLDFEKNDHDTMELNEDIQPEEIYD